MEYLNLEQRMKNVLQK